MEVNTLVIDNGSYTVRAGFGGDVEPSCVIPSVVGWVKGASSATNADGTSNFFLGGDSLSCSSGILLRRPIENRVIANFDDMERIWQHVFADELGVSAAEHPVLMTESPENPKSARERTLQIMMETFGVPAFYLAYPEVLSLFAAGATTGAVVDAGETLTHVLPVYECFGMTHVCARMEVGGRQLNGHLKRLLAQAGAELPAGYERESLRDIKEQLCYVAADADAEAQRVEQMSAAERRFALRSGATVEVGAQRFLCTEPLFNPGLVGVESPGIAQLVNETVGKCDDLKQQMFANVLLTGGTSMFRGFAERIESELASLCPSEKINVVALPNRKHCAWIGGSVLVSLATFSQSWITKPEYDEVGPGIVHLKCF